MAILRFLPTAVVLAAEFVEAEGIGVVDSARESMLVGSSVVGAVEGRTELEDSILGERAGRAEVEGSGDCRAGAGGGGGGAREVLVEAAVDEEGT